MKPPSKLLLMFFCSSPSPFWIFLRARKLLLQGVILAAFSIYFQFGLWGNRYLSRFLFVDMRFDLYSDLPFFVFQSQICFFTISVSSQYGSKLVFFLYGGLGFYLWILFVFFLGFLLNCSILCVFVGASFLLDLVGRGNGFSSLFGIFLYKKERDLYNCRVNLWFFNCDQSFTKTHISLDFGYIKFFSRLNFLLGIYPRFMHFVPFLVSFFVGLNILDKTRA